MPPLLTTFHPSRRDHWLSICNRSRSSATLLAPCNPRWANQTTLSFFKKAHKCPNFECKYTLRRNLEDPHCKMSDCVLISSSKVSFWDLIILLNNLCAEVDKTFRWHLCNSNVRVQLLVSILIIIPFPCNVDMNHGGHIPYTSAPNGFVELHIQPRITSSHGLLGKLADLLDCLGTFFLNVLCW